jgi:hypothetical protein
MTIDQTCHACARVLLWAGGKLVCCTTTCSLYGQPNSRVTGDFLHFLQPLPYVRAREGGPA